MSKITNLGIEGFRKFSQLEIPKSLNFFSHFEFLTEKMGFSVKH